MTWPPYLITLVAGLGIGVIYGLSPSISQHRPLPRCWAFWACWQVKLRCNGSVGIPMLSQTPCT